MTKTTTGVHSPAQKRQTPLWKEVDAMNEAELREKLIQQYTDLQRIRSAADMKKEVDYQITTVKAKLEAIGLTTENLDIH